MNAKEYLESIKKADTVINEKLKECDALRGMRYKITQTLKPVMVSGGGSQGGFTGASDRLIDLEREIDIEVDRFVDLKREAGALLALLKNERHYKVLHRHYIQFESLEKIAVDMGCTYRWACILHGRALQAFQKVLDKRKSEQRGN